MASAHRSFSRRTYAERSASSAARRSSSPSSGKREPLRLDAPAEEGVLPPPPLPGGDDDGGDEDPLPEEEVRGVPGGPFPDGFFPRGVREGRGSPLAPGEGFSQF